MNKETYSALGKFIDVGGYRLHVYPVGEGSPTVVFEAGGGNWSLDWHLIQTEVAKFTCACSYDRAGFGWSDPGVKPRTSEQMVKELHTLLLQAGIPKPFILVGTSYGGHPVRLYARHYPEEVAGIILIDARHESLNSKMPPAWKQMEKGGKAVLRFMLLASRLNILSLVTKLMGDKAMPPIAKKLPPEILPMYLEVGFTSKYWANNLDELEASDESDKQVSAAGSLGNLPLTVIRHGIPDLFTHMPGPQAEQAEKVWQELQRELSRLSTNSRLLVAANSGHAIQINQPEIVIKAIRQMVDEVRSMGSSSDIGQ
jgi:pimeloyl-ACP methyl ester carboxylesterase